VKQEEVQPGYWELTVLDVDVKGKALFFKTIGVQEEMKRNMFRRVRDDLTAAQGANLFYQQVPTICKTNSAQSDTLLTSWTSRHRMDAERAMARNTSSRFTVITPPIPL
jgi:hypothetical protein